MSLGLGEQRVRLYCCVFDFIWSCYIVIGVCRSRDFIFIFLYKILRFLCGFCATFIVAERMERYRRTWMHNSLYVCIIAVCLAIIQAGIACCSSQSEFITSLSSFVKPSTITVIDSHLSSLNKWNHAGRWRWANSAYVCIIAVRLTLKLLLIGVWRRSVCGVIIIPSSCVVQNDSITIMWLLCLSRMERYRWTWTWMHDNSLYVCIAVVCLALKLAVMGVPCSVVR